MRCINYIYFFVAFNCLFTLHLFPQTVRYVKSNATGLNNGTSWSNAYTSLETAISNSSSGNQIWVASGTYKPTTQIGGTGARYAAFRMKDGVGLYGGFSGNETLLEQRDFNTNETILSGDIGTTGDNSDNCYHVIYNPAGDWLALSTRLDGFTVRDGNANLAGTYPHNYGGAIYMYLNASPTIANCKINYNSSASGGGIYLEKTNAVIMGCVFENNATYSLMISLGGSPSIYNSIFRNNTSSAVYIGGAANPSFINCLFHSNTAGNGAAIQTFAAEGTTNVVNCTFTENYASSLSGGGAIAQILGGAMNISNSIIWGNSARGGAQQFVVHASSLVINYSDYSNSANDIAISGGGSFTATNNNISVQPDFAGEVDNPSYPFSLLGTSPCTDAGNNSYISESFDIRGSEFSRMLNKLDGSAGTVDIGAYEYKYGTDPAQTSLVQASNVTLVQAKASQLSFSFTNGSGTRRAVFMQQGTSGSAQPVDHTQYTASQIFGDGAQIGSSGWYCVYDGPVVNTESSTSVTVTGLSLSTEYIVHAVEYSGSETDPDFDIRTATGNPGVFATTNNKYFVKTDGNDANTGTDWTHAFQTLQKALDVSEANANIWIASGVYKPAKEIFEIGPQNAAFVMVEGVQIYGGFAGNEADISERDISANETILSGDIGVEGDSSDNVYHVIYNDESNYPALSYLLNGVTISGGNALLQSSSGGGISASGSSPILVSCKFKNNYGLTSGGALSILGGDLEVTNCTFLNNSSTNGGGAIYKSGGNFRLVNSLFYRNVGEYGGAISASGTALTVINTTISDNQGSNGGAFYLFSSTAEIQNSILWGNTALSQGQTIYSESSDITISFTCFLNNEANIFQSFTTLNLGAGNISTNPAFAGSRVNSAHPYSLFGLSPCVDVGNNGLNSRDYDIRGSNFPRKLSKVDGSSGTIDIGAYEYKFGTDLLQRIPIYVKLDASGLNSGTSWNDAFYSLEDALNSATNGDQIWVAEGTYYPSTEVGGSGNEFKAFRMRDGVQILGGFSGTESLVSQRNPAIYKTYLSGELGLSGNDYDNAYYVINNEGQVLSDASILDGFVIKKGFTAGLNNTALASPTIIGCTFHLNGTMSGGGGIKNYDGSISVKSCSFENNSSYFGGGISNSGSGTLGLVNSVIRGNAAQWGGGLFNEGNIIIKNCTIADNSATYGGGLFLRYGGSNFVDNSIIWNNSAGYGGGQIFIEYSTSLVLKSTCYRDDYNDITVRGTFSPDANCIVTDPLFAGVVTSPDHPYLILGVSPCVDAGDNNLIDLDADVRLGSNIRKADKNTGGAGIVDMGAYEYQFARDPYDENGPLPVEMVSFTGKFTADCITLRWETKTEIDNYGFEIERSKDGDNWSKIGFIEGSGTSNSPKYYSFDDKSRLNRIVRYRLKQLDNTGTFAYSDVITVDVGIPKEFSLSQNFPNPFNPTTTINFDLSEPVYTTLSIFNIAGEKVKTLVDAPMEAGRYGIVFDASALSSGIYFYRLQSGKFVQTRKIILMK